MNIFKNPWKLSGIAGILFVLVSFVASGINKMPPAYSVEADHVAWFAENGQWYRFGHYLAGMAFLLFYFPFYAGLCERLRKAEGEPAIWTRITWAGAIMSPAIGTIAGTFIMSLAMLGGAVTPSIAQYGMAGNFYAYTVSGAFGGIAMTAASIIIIRSGVFARWTGWAGMITGTAAILSIATLIQNDPSGQFAAINGIAWLVYFLWIVAVSVELIRRPVRAG
jgi:hypothetical protein